MSLQRRPRHFKRLTDSLLERRWHIGLVRWRRFQIAQISRFTAQKFGIGQRSIVTILIRVKIQNVFLASNDLVELKASVIARGHTTPKPIAPCAVVFTWNLNRVLNGLSGPGFFDFATDQPPRG